jgi:hypothetical protein
VLQAEQHAEYVRVESRGVGFRRLVHDGAGVALCPGVVDGDVDAPEPGDSTIDQGSHIALVANVRLDEQSVCFVDLELGLQCRAGLGVATGDDDLVALASGASAVAWPMPARAPVIITTSSFIFRSPYRKQSTRKFFDGIRLWSCHFAQTATSRW